VVESLLHRRASRLGGARIRQELLAKGVEPARAAAAMASLKSTELERCREVWRKKFGEPPQDAAQRAKHARFLAARGFGGEVIARVLRMDD
jgi:regulatory protein